jgi:hypothetical protein
MISLLMYLPQPAHKPLYLLAFITVFERNSTQLPSPYVTLINSLAYARSYINPSYARYGMLIASAITLPPLTLYRIHIVIIYY